MCAYIRNAHKHLQQGNLSMSLQTSNLLTISSILIKYQVTNIILHNVL